MDKQAGSERIGLLIENRFELVSAIGRGGMANVFKAQHRQVDLTVAVKILNYDAVVSESELERLRREARALNSLFHPNIVKVYSFGVLDDGAAYLVLDYLEGRSLETLIETEGPPKLDWAMNCFRQICNGLTYAHESGLIHRDLKPSNVMVLHQPQEGADIKILDFGLSRADNTAGKKEQRLTKIGEIQGSPLYMSPEQIQGKEADIRSDIYSLGCLMYETLSGQPPLMGETTIATLMKHMQQLPEPFAQVKGSSQVPAKLEQLVFQCMEKDPNKRFQTVREVESALKESLSA
ncbi:MAG: serine/threonine protein kinase [Candidatus Obscuribacterales bacterium]|nr:serine/threonine protein kinase [Candidatus Obscuribacterales bacterium]